MIRGVEHRQIDSSVKNLFARLETIGLGEESTEVGLAHVASLISQEPMLAGAFHKLMATDSAIKKIDAAAAQTMRENRDESAGFHGLALDKDVSDVLDAASKEAGQWDSAAIKLDHMIVSLLEHDTFCNHFLPLDERQWCEALAAARQRLKSRVYTVYTHTPTLDLHSRDHTADVRNGRLPWPVCGREAEIQQMLRVLLRRTKRNPLLVGPAGAGKSTLLTGLAEHIIEKPTFFANYRICELDIGSLISGTLYRGELEARIKRILKELEENPTVLLCIDEIHLIQTGGSENSANVAEFFKAGLARDLSVIGATCPEQLDQLFRDSAIERRFEPIFIEPLDSVSVRRVLESVHTSLAGHYRESFDVELHVPDDVLEEIPVVAAKTLAGRVEPDVSITLLQDAVASVLAASGRETDSGQTARIDLSLEHVTSVAKAIQSTTRRITRARRMFGRSSGSGGRASVSTRSQDGLPRARDN